MAAVNTTLDGTVFTQNGVHPNTANTVDHNPDSHKMTTTMPDYNILSGMTIWVSRPSGNAFKDVLDSFLTEEGQTMLATERDTTHYSFEALMNAVRAGLKPNEIGVGDYLGDYSGRTIRHAGEFRCHLLAIVTGKCQMGTDTWGNPCLKLYYDPRFLVELPKPTSSSQTPEAQMKKDLEDLRGRLAKTAMTTELNRPEPSLKNRSALRVEPRPRSPVSTASDPTADDKIEIVNEAGDIMSDDGRGGWESSSAGSPSYTPQGLSTELFDRDWGYNHYTADDDRQGWAGTESEHVDVPQVTPEECMLGTLRYGMAQSIACANPVRHLFPAWKDFENSHVPSSSGYDAEALGLSYAAW